MMTENRRELYENEEDYMMQSKIATFPSAEAEAKSTPTNQLPTTDYYDRAEQQFIQLLETEDLDKKLAAQSSKRE